VVHHLGSKHLTAPVYNVLGGSSPEGRQVCVRACSQGLGEVRRNPNQSQLWGPQPTSKRKLHKYMNAFNKYFNPLKTNWLLYIPPALTHWNTSLWPHSVFLCSVRFSQ
jgi:hypothetical protein